MIPSQGGGGGGEECESQKYIYGLFEFLKVQMFGNDSGVNEASNFSINV